VLSRGLFKIEEGGLVSVSCVSINMLADSGYERLRMRCESVGVVIYLGSRTIVKLKVKLNFY
jgi:hypothetical protein